MKTGLRCGERLVRCLSGGDVDRVPFGVNFGWNPWTETLANWRRELGRPELDVANEFGYDAGFACPSLESGPLPHFEPLTISETAEHVVTRDWRGVTQRNRRDGGSIPEFLDYPVKTPADWEDLRDTRSRRACDLGGHRWRLRRTRAADDAARGQHVLPLRGPGGQ